MPLPDPIPTPLEVRLSLVLALYGLPATPWQLRVAAAQLVALRQRQSTHLLKEVPHA